MAVNIADLRNIRYNSFTGVYTPLRITGEEQTVPGTAPYIFYLNESPLQVVPSTVVAKVQGGPTLIEQSKTTIPGVNQFRLNYDAKGNGQLEVNPQHKNKIIEIDYDGLGSGLSVQTISELITSQGTYDSLICNTLNVLLQGPIVIQDQKPNNTNGGTYSVGTWQKRDLNTITYNPGNHASISSSQITLSPGTYLIDAESQCAIGDAMIRLQNITDGVTALWGISENSVRSASLKDVFTIIAEKTFELQIRGGASVGTADLGKATPWTVDHETYTVAVLQKLL